MSIPSKLSKRCDIQRPSHAVATSTIRDIKVTYSTVATNVQCRIDPIAKGYERSNFGAIPTESFVVFFASGTDVRVNDRLIIDGKTYEVEEMKDFTVLKRTGHKETVCALKNLAQ